MNSCVVIDALLQELPDTLHYFREYISLMRYFPDWKSFVFDKSHIVFFESLNSTTVKPLVDKINYCCDQEKQNEMLDILYGMCDRGATLASANYELVILARNLFPSMADDYDCEFGELLPDIERMNHIIRCVNACLC